MNGSYVVSVILNTNRRDDTLACLDSIRADGYVPHDIIVLDNASTDGSEEAIHAAFPHVEVVQLTENLGYAGNNNVGISIAIMKRADWVLILNEDVIVAPDAISKMLEIAEQEQEVGIVGPLVYHHSEPEVIQSAGGVLDTFWLSRHRGENERDIGEYIHPEDVDWVSGCAMLVRREVVEQVGALDERFFYYWEETEWCIRARRSGWRVVFTPQAKIWHKGVQRDYTPSPNITYYWTRNWFLTLAKHRAPFYVWIYAIIQISRSVLSWTFRPKWRDKLGNRDAMIEGVLDFIFQRWGMRNSG
jgi:GT2 family glycosyltransferase